MLTYILFKTQSMLLSATSRKVQQDADLHTVQNPDHAHVSNKQEGPARSWLTICSKPKACSCQQQAGKKPDADLQPVQYPEHALVSNKQKELARCWLTPCSKCRACSCQQQAGRTSQMLTYNLFKTQSMLLSATSRKVWQDADLHPVQNPDHTLISNKQEGPSRCWLTLCSNLVSNKQEGLARCWLTACPNSRACSCQQQAGRTSQMLTYILFKSQSMLLSATSRKD